MLSGLGDTQRRLLQVLQREPAGLAVEALARALQVTLTAVRQHLAALGRDGLVVKVASTPSGGRPAHCYALSSQARESFPRQYPWFSEVLLEELRDRLGAEAVEQTLRTLGVRAAGAPPAPTRPLSERAAAVVARMAELGYDAHLSSAFDGPRSAAEITAHNCVFHQLALKHPEVCAFDLGLIAQASGAQVSHAECMVRGGRACRFQLAPGPSRGRRETPAVARQGGLKVAGRPGRAS
jgi:predicted ArsR family transcriptional regulator